VYVVGVGYCSSDIPMLVGGAADQTRLLNNSPIPISTEMLTQLYEKSLKYWD
jgi:hypothetical protein